MLSKEEQETIINFNKAEAVASIFTYEKSWQRHLEKRLGLKPIKDNGFGAREYELDKKLIRMPMAKRQMSAEQREKMAARGRALGALRRKGKVVKKPRLL
jgi:hypothetical protein